MWLPRGMARSSQFLKVFRFFILTAQQQVRDRAYRKLEGANPITMCRRCCRLVHLMKFWVAPYWTLKSGTHTLHCSLTRTWLLYSIWLKAREKVRAQESLESRRWPKIWFNLKSQSSRLSLLMQLRASHNCFLSKIFREWWMKILLSMMSHRRMTYPTIRDPQMRPRS